LRRRVAMTETRHTSDCPPFVRVISHAPRCAPHARRRKGTMVGAVLAAVAR
jgi:hypothetical protein